MMKSGIAFSALLLIVAYAPTAMADDLETILSGAQENLEFTDSELMSAMKKSLAPISAEDHLLLGNIQQGDWKKAFLQATLNYKTGSSAERAQIDPYLPYLQFKAGMKVTAIERAFEGPSTKSYPAALKKAWTDVKGELTNVWPILQVRWRDDMTGLFGTEAEARLTYYREGFVRNVDVLKRYIEKAAPNSFEKDAWLWHLQLNFALSNKTDQAARVLAQLMKSKNPIRPLDLMNITAGRMLYQSGFMDAAIEYYKKIPRGSDYWTTAQEEMGWAYVRKAQPQNTIAVTESLVQPALHGMVGPESYFIRGLAQLKVCDYSGVIQTLKGYKGAFREKAVQLKETGGSGNTEAIQTLLAQLRDGKIKWEKLGPLSEKLPRSALVDEKLKYFAKTDALLTKESAVAEDLFSISLTSTGLQGQFENQKNKVKARLNQVRQSSVERVRELARRESGEIKTILDKLHIVEAEMLQQITVAQGLKQVHGTGEMKGAPTRAVAKDTLSFPTGDENWLDEIGQYKVDVKAGCQGKKKL